MELQAQTSQTQTFNTSTRRLRTYILGLGIFITLLLLATAAWKVQTWDAVMVGVTAGMVAGVWLGSLPLGWFILARSQRKLRLHVGPDGVCRQQGAVRQLVPWAAITRVRVRQGGGNLDRSRQRERWERLEQDARFGKIVRALSWLRPRTPEPYAVEVYTAEGRALYLHEFERMDEIARLLQAGVSPEVQVERVGLFG